MSSKIKVNKEIMEKVLILNCRKEADIRRLDKSLMKLPFIKDDSDLEIDRMEEIVMKLERKLKINLSYFMKYYLDDGTYSYTCMIKTKDGGWLETIHAATISEGFKKVIFYYYYYSQNKEKIKARKV